MIDTSKQRESILSKLPNHSDRSTTLSLRPQELADQSNNELCDHFCRVLNAHNTITKTVSNIEDVPQVVSEYLTPLTQTATLYGGKQPNLSNLNWAEFNLSWSNKKFLDDGQVAFAVANYGVADTGTVVIMESEDNPTQNNFLAEHHIVLIKKSTIHPYSEDVWQHIQTNSNALPRTINFISGPSSSADVGMKLEYGAHGPRSLLIIILDN